MRETGSLLTVWAAVTLAVVVGACTGSSTPAPPAGSPIGAASPSSAVMASPSPSPSPTADAQRSPEPSPSPETSPSPVPIPPLTETFRSPTMGYTVRYPKGWKVFKATEPWRPGQDDYWDDPNGDRIESADAGFRGGSQPLLPGQTGKAWLDTYIAAWPEGCGVREEIPLGGTTATIGLNGCHGLGRLGGQVYDLVLVVGERAYNFTMEGAVDHAFLLAMLRTIEFDPSSAVD